MVGYACSETPQMMPLPVVLAHRLTNALSAARKTGMIRGLRPDGKAQVTVEYGEDGTPCGWTLSSFRPAQPGKTRG